MQIKRFQTTDMRAALRQIREQLGPDAVILSSRNFDDGVEVCAAVDIEFAGGALGEQAALKALEQGAATASAATGKATGKATGAAKPAAVANPARAESSLAVLQSEERFDERFFDAAMSGSPAGAAASEAASVTEELRGLRALLTQQLAALAWNDFTRREPLKARALADLTALGVGREISQDIVAELPAQMSAEQAQRLPYALLARRLKTVEPPCADGGVLLIAGPSGGGKTTTLAKIAARWVLQHGAEGLTLLSTDDERLGAHDQMRTLARLLGARFEVTTLERVGVRAAAAAPRTLTLIDTAGASARATETIAAIAALRSAMPAMHTLLVLPASAQAAVIEAALTQFTPVAPSACVLTRVDEALSLGGALGALVRAALPVAYVSEGPQVPEDLKPARAHQLVARAVERARHSGAQADEDLLVRRFGGSLNAAA
jgi:flagellar biosynthesis protein FlhF